MSTTLTVALYFVIWWTLLFAVLPFGVRSQIEDGNVPVGSEGAAPSRPRLLQKALWTSLVSAVLLAVIWVVVEYQLIGLNDFPFGPRFD